ncbi:hypothetical protein KY308_01655, partial [Candidatus Woesearchaeota archaeon]|nr:hypothetical protein [Candidatus Woesearchaeota archaeon]
MAKKKSRKRSLYLAAITLAVLIALLDLLFFGDSAWFFPLIVLSVGVAIAPYWASFLIKLQQQKEIELRFPEFVRNLSGAIKSGMPAPRAI